MLTELASSFAGADPLISQVVVVCAAIVAVMLLRRRDR
jgi:hypothetical protein